MEKELYDLLIEFFGRKKLILNGRDLFRCPFPLYICNFLFWMLIMFNLKELLLQPDEYNLSIFLDRVVIFDIIAIVEGCLVFNAFSVNGSKQMKINLETQTITLEKNFKFFSIPTKVIAFHQIDKLGLYRYEHKKQLPSGTNYMVTQVFLGYHQNDKSSIETQPICSIADEKWDFENLIEVLRIIVKDPNLIRDKRTELTEAAQKLKKLRQNRHLFYAVIVIWHLILTLIPVLFMYYQQIYILPYS